MSNKNNSLADSGGGKSDSEKCAGGTKTYKTVHMCMDVRGALHNWSDREMQGVFTDADGKPLSIREAKEFLMDEIAKGHRVIPIGDCDQFDFQTGCPGHITSCPESE